MSPSAATLPTDVVWFRRDLRVADNEALAAAVQRVGPHGRVVPLFVLDPDLLSAPRVGAPRRGFLADALAGLDASLRQRGGRLTLRRGDPRHVVPQLAADVAAEDVRWAEDVSPFAARRDAEVQRRLEADGRAVTVHGGVLVHPAGSIRTSNDQPYRVFTPFQRAWQQHDQGDPQPAPTYVTVHGHAGGEALPTRAALDATSAPAEPVGGERMAQQRLGAFLADRADTYHQRRDLLDVDGTSRLSADLHYGCLSPRQVLAALDPERRGHTAFAAEIAWRDFYAHVLAAFPEVVDTEFNPVWRDLPWEQDGPGWRAWRNAETGFPVVDAALRQLAQTGWMHNRARMIVASFLTKDLRVDWRLGEAHFLRSLVDGDIASNNGGWQWAAGTGTDAQPYFRIFNPVTQGERFDPEGAYVRYWIPELARLGSRHIHAPWKLGPLELQAAGVQLGRDYPEPIVDHQAERARTLAWFKDHRRAG